MTSPVSQISPATLAELRRDVVGLDTPVPLAGGGQRRYVFLDNAASTPTFHRVLRKIEEFLPWYSGVHRGVGLKAVVATHVFDETREVVARFVGAHTAEDVVLYVKNTTEAANKLARRFRFGPGDVVVTTALEHHSNDLPWRAHCRTVHVPVGADGVIDLDALRHEIRRHAGALRVVAVSGASNVTGVCSPMYDIATWAHEAGAHIFVDAAQLAPHRPIDILPADDPRHIDFLAFSGHKIYAPFGSGVLIGPKAFFHEGSPEAVGGGAVAYVGLDSVEWASLPHKEEAGSPNVVGAVALAEALTILSAVGMEAIARHEQELLAYAIDRMKKISSVRIYGPTDDLSRKVGVLPFTVDAMDHALVATILSAEGGIGVRNGNFCAQPYMRGLLNVSQEEEQLKRAARCDNPILPGMVRASFGCYNNEEDVDLFIEMLERIVRRDFQGSYAIDPITGMYASAGTRTEVPPHLRFFPSERRNGGHSDVPEY